ncbi:aldehyde-activating protein [Aliikangiella marina]|uniref:Aldehyde-activating protein n=1 Tax=Aliikangiella marina TaxID=1712262 RepID=A0A545T100_9GAMM|nr:aldehyde-activating protein [Aliikangiella marina]TQV70895.1 aldehyde-activating protein [Aliikangiella marina]
MLINGQCGCGKTRFKVDMPHPMQAYHPRRCDCDFCLPRQIQYISDPDGILFLKKGYLAHTLQQGDELAEFITCSYCEEVIAVIYRDSKEQKAAANATLLESKHDFSEPETVSPKLLAADEKIARWHSLWFDLVLE